MRYFMLVLIILSSTTAVGAKPQVVVRGQATFSEFDIKRTGQGVHIAGRLVDDQERPISQVTVRFNQPLNRDIQTDSLGRFRLFIREPSPKVSQISAEYTGSEHMAGSAIRRPFTAAPPRETLSLQAPPTTSVGEQLTVRAQLTDAQGDAVQKATLELQVDGRPLSQCRTRSKGQCVWRLSQLTRGKHEFRAVRTYPSGAQFERFQTVVVQQKIEAEMTLREVYEGRDPALRIRLSTLGPRPKRGVAGVRVGQHTVATTPLSREGAILRIPWGSLAEGANQISAFIRADSTHWLRFESPVQTYQRPGAWVSSAWPKWALGISVLLCLMVVSNRMWSRSTLITPMIEAPRRPPPSTEKILHRGRSAGPPVIRVMDAMTNEPLKASITPLTQPQWDQLDLSVPFRSVNTLETNSAGHITLRRIAYGVVIEAPSFCPASILIPSKCAQLNVRLWPPRATVENRFVELLAAAGVPPLRFGRETAREAGILLVERGADAIAVEALVHRVNSLCFGHKTPTMDDVHDIEQRIARVSQQLSIR